MINKSILYRILRSSIVTLGGVSLLVILSLFLLGGGLGTLALAIVVSPYIEGSFILCAVLFILYGFLYFLKWRREEGYTFGKIVLIIGVISTALTAAQIYSNFAIKSAQTSFEKVNPVIVGTQVYDFSKDILFHTGVHVFLSEMHIVGNTVIWTETTKQSPPYPRRVDDLFAFIFDTTESKGTVAQITHFDKTAPPTSHRIQKAAYVVNGKIYWLEGIATGGQDSIEEYDPISGTQQELLKGDVIFLKGGYGNYLMLQRPIVKPNGYSANAVSLYDISTKNELPLDEWSSESVVFGDGYFCHATKNNSIGIYDLAKKEELIIKTPATDRTLGYSMAIIGCSRSYILYSFAPLSPPGTPSVFETHLLALKTNGLIDDENINLKSDKTVLVNNYLFYAVANVVYRKDLSLGNEAQILLSDGLGEWNTDGNYLVYSLATDQGKSTFHIKKINP